MSYSTAVHECSDTEISVVTILMLSDASYLSSSSTDHLYYSPSCTSLLLLFSLLSEGICFRSTAKVVCDAILEKPVFVTAGKDDFEAILLASHRSLGASYGQSLDSHIHTFAFLLLSDRINP